MVTMKLTLLYISGTKGAYTLYILVKNNAFKLKKHISRKVKSQHIYVQ
jgi:hypothetical protein